MRRTAAILAPVVVTEMPPVGQPGGVPVHHGGVADGPACAGTSRVVGLNPRGDNFLAVRTGPSTDYRKADELHTNDVVADCERRGAWVGVVYGGRQCGAFDVVPGRTVYNGPCRTGWVHGRYLADLAG